MVHLKLAQPYKSAILNKDEKINKRGGQSKKKKKEEEKQNPW